MTDQKGGPSVANEARPGDEDVGVPLPSFQFTSRLARVKGASRARGGRPGRQVNVWAKLYPVVRDAVGVVALIAVMLGIAGGVAAAILIVGRLFF